MKSIIIITLIGCIWSGCYTFRGIDIPEGVNTFNVTPFENRAANVVPTMSVALTEALKDKIRRESRLTFNATDPDIIFNGSISDYTVTAVAPKPGETTAFNQARLVISIEFINIQDEKKNWKQNFSYLTNFPSSTNLLTVQEQLLTEINDQLTEDIFNKAFTNW